MGYQTLCLSCYILSNRLYILFFAIQESEYLAVCYPTCICILCSVTNCMSCSVLSNHRYILCLAIVPSAYLVICNPTAIYGLSCLPGATHLVTGCFIQRLKSADLRICSSHLAVLDFYVPATLLFWLTTFITALLLCLTSDSVPRCAR
jgi:hypothetical protein